jgi:hypothetical protein
MVTGIPSVPVFATLGSKKQSIKKLGLEGESGRPIVMITASGARFEGQPSVLTIYKQALSVPTPMEVIVVTGRQKDLRAELEKIEVPPQHSVKLEGFTTQMHEYARASERACERAGGARAKRVRRTCSSAAEAGKGGGWRGHEGRERNQRRRSFCGRSRQNRGPRAKRARRKKGLLILVSHGRARAKRARRKRGCCYPSSMGSLQS